MQAMLNMVLHVLGLDLNVKLVTIQALSYTKTPSQASFWGERRPATDCSRMRKIIGYFSCKISHNFFFYQKKYMVQTKYKL